MVTGLNLDYQPGVKVFLFHTQVPKGWSENQLYQHHLGSFSKKTESRVPIYRYTESLDLGDRKKNQCFSKVPQGTLTCC